MNYIILFLIFFTQLVGAQPIKKKNRADDQPIIIIGIVVDQKGHPIPNPRVALSFNCFTCGLDANTPSGMSFDNGGFHLNTEFYPPKSSALYISEPEPDGYWSPLGFPPSNKREARLLGIRPIKIVPIKNKTLLDLGKVQAQLTYQKIQINLPSLFENLYHPSEDAANSLLYELSDIHGTPIGKGYFPIPYAFDKTYTNLKLALPKKDLILKVSFSMSPTDKSEQTIKFSGASSECSQIEKIEGKIVRAACK